MFTPGVDDLARSLADQVLPFGMLAALVGTLIFALLFCRPKDVAGVVTEVASPATAELTTAST